MTDDTEVRRHLGRAVECAAPDGDGLQVVVGLVEVGRVVDTMLREAVASARADGLTWAALGEALGTSRQAVQKRFGPDATEPTSEWAVPASRREEVAELGKAGQRGYRLRKVGIAHHELEHVGGVIEHARAVGISGEAQRLVADGWNVAGWRFPDVFFWRTAESP